MPGFVIHLSDGNTFNGYGYWTGNVFYSDGVSYPSYEDEKTHDNVKVYTSKKRAETMAEKLRFRCSYIVSATVEEVED